MLCPSKSKVKIDRSKKLHLKFLLSIIESHWHDGHIYILCCNSMRYEYIMSEIFNYILFFVDHKLCLIYDVVHHLKKISYQPNYNRYIFQK